MSSCPRTVLSRQTYCPKKTLRHLSRIFHSPAGQIRARPAGCLAGGDTLTRHSSHPSASPPTPPTRHNHTKSATPYQHALDKCTLWLVGPADV